LGFTSPVTVIVEFAFRGYSVLKGKFKIRD
jgi:hypothetical protein